jgi:hypothetical protein
MIKESKSILANHNQLKVTSTLLRPAVATTNEVKANNLKKARIIKNVEITYPKNGLYGLL